ncbi:hypothetical protein A3A69_01105 [candidate division WWE3 bacterium RIFCSPLOWO2_01_FULL_37_15]|uniref:Uncharacterized protein n=1 Tax=candidate division WWE3 bacterium RIFCSPLOWO2_01_FULL_37_15 TaxID=1802622 RepID=A0A1F4V1D8_UNCKA|nr:MAG: hypothetical protein A3A69_01105 [candidate division WWE3 bacterium RIFCSPLOWO2_01_FULL_37_15]
MIQDVKAPITAYLAYEHRKNRVFPFLLKWDGRNYKVQSLDFHYTYKNGAVLYHVFSVSTETLSFKLVLNTENLFWTVEQITDGLPE